MTGKSHNSVSSFTAVSSWHVLLSHGPAVGGRGCPAVEARQSTRRTPPRPAPAKGGASTGLASIGLLTDDPPLEGKDMQSIKTVRIPGKVGGFLAHKGRRGSLWSNRCHDAALRAPGNHLKSPKMHIQRRVPGSVCNKVWLRWRFDWMSKEGCGFRVDLASLTANDLAGAEPPGDVPHQCPQKLAPRRSPVLHSAKLSQPNVHVLGTKHQSITGAQNLTQVCLLGIVKIRELRYGSDELQYRAGQIRTVGWAEFELIMRLNRP
jgi:hypothetical protein